MGIEFFLISYDLPGQTTFLPIYSFVDGLNNRMFRRLPYPTITRNDSIPSIVNRICGQLSPNSLDVLRIFAHGNDTPNGAYSLGGEHVHILLGEGLTPNTARSFFRVHSLWHTTSPGGPPHSITNIEPNEGMRRVRPRIEVHACWASISGAQPALRALASAAGAPVFAASRRQVFARPSAGPRWQMTNWNLEGEITSFYP